MIATPHSSLALRAPECYPFTGLASAPVERLLRHDSVVALEASKLAKRIQSMRGDRSASRRGSDWHLFGSVSGFCPRGLGVSRPRRTAPREWVL